MFHESQVRYEIDICELSNLRTLCWVCVQLMHAHLFNHAWTVDQVFSHCSCLVIFVHAAQATRTAVATQFLKSTFNIKGVLVLQILLINNVYRTRHFMRFLGIFSVQGNEDCMALHGLCSVNYTISITIRIKWHDKVLLFLCFNWSDTSNNKTQLAFYISELIESWSLERFLCCILAFSDIYI